MAVSAVKHKHWNEMVGLLLFAIGLLIMLSLVSYSAIDPCFSVSGSGAAIRNTIGIIGAYLSDALLHLFGLSAYVIPLLMFGYALFFTLGQEAAHPLLKKIGGIVFFLSAGAFFGLGSETTRRRSSSSPPTRTAHPGSTRGSRPTACSPAPTRPRRAPSRSS